MNNITGLNTTSLASLCYNAPGLHPMIIYGFQFAYWYLLGTSFFVSGLSFLMNNVRMSTIGLLVQTFGGMVIWFIEIKIQWARPDLLSTSNCIQSIFFYNVLNLYGGPDPFFIPTFSYFTFIIYRNFSNHQRGYNILLIPIISAAFVYHLVAEFALGRIFWYQYLTNIIITAIVAAIVIVCVHNFYEPDMREHYDVQMTISYNEMTNQQKWSFHQATSDYHELAAKQREKISKEEATEDARTRSFRIWHLAYIADALRSILEKIEDPYLSGDGRPSIVQVALREKAR